MGRPAWSVSQVHPAYPTTKFFSGAASAASLEQARQLARQRLVQGLSRELARLPGQARLPPVKELLGPTADIPIVLTWSSSDSSRHAALAAVDRSELGQGIGQQEEAAAQQAAQLLAKARELQDKIPYSALLNLLAAHHFEAQARRQAALRRTLAGAQAAGDKGKETVLKSQEALAAWFSHLRLSLIRGDGQKARPGKALPAPLVVAVEWLEQGLPRPVARMPLRFELLQLSAKAESHRSAENGWVTASPMIPAGAAGRIQVQVSLDLSQMLQDAGVSQPRPLSQVLDRQAAGIKLSARLHIPSADMPRCIVLVAESQEGDFVSNPVTVLELDRLLDGWGCDVVSREEVELKIPDAPTEADIVAALRGQVRWIIIGEAASVLDRELSETFVFSQAWGRLSLYSGDDGKERKRFEGKLKSPGTDAKTAGKRALKKLCGKALEDFRPVLDAGGEAP